ncbi:MAG: hypothetical protein AMXMBFR58_20870 [Phycisphaerae bacterium]
MKKIVCLGAVALLALCGCDSNEKSSNMSVMSGKDGACCAEKDAKTCAETSADKSNMSVMSEKKECSGEAKTCSDKNAKTCSEKGAEKSNMSVMSDKKECSGEGKTCPVTGKSGENH